MEMTPLRLALATGIGLVIVALAWEIRRWGGRASVVNRKQKGLRVASAIMCLLILGMMLAGDTWLARYGPLAVMAYWILCFGFAVALVCLALLDFKQVGLAYGEAKKQIYRDLATPTDRDDENRNGG